MQCCRQCLPYHKDSIHYVPHFWRGISKNARLLIIVVTCCVHCGIGCLRLGDQFEIVGCAVSSFDLSPSTCTGSSFWLSSLDFSFGTDAKPAMNAPVRSSLLPFFYHGQCFLVSLLLPVRHSLYSCCPLSLPLTPAIFQWIILVEEALTNYSVRWVCLCCEAGILLSKV